MAKIAVLGLGRFGMHLARELGRAGVEVIAADRNGRLVDEVKDDVAIAVQMDITDQDAMKAQAIGDVDVAVVAIGEGFEAALLTTLVAKNLGAEKVIARAQTSLQADILSRVGADEVVRPETAVAHQLARRLTYPHLEDLIELDADHSVIKLRAPASFVGKTLSVLKLRKRYRVNLVGIKRTLPPESEGQAAREQMIAVPDAEDVIQEQDVLLLVGHHDALAELPQH